MARPAKTNLDYFPLDCNLDQKFQLLEAEHGIIGFGIVIRLFQTIYGEEGYYMKWDRDSLILFASKIAMDGDINYKANLVSSVVDTALNRGIFSKEMYDKHKILTSKGIQERYAEALKRRQKIFLENAYLLLKSPKNEVNVAETGVNVAETSINVNSNAINKSKVNNSIYSARTRNKFNNFEQREKKDEDYYNSLLYNSKESS
jgi:hypothetical protein